jgi:toxin ParE1/3/4
VAERAIIWSPEARADLSEIWDYYSAAASRRTADSIIRRIVDATRMLEDHPFAGRSRDEVRDGLRSLAAAPHVIFYHVAAGKTAEIVRVIDGRRDIEAVFDESEN